MKYILVIIMLLSRNAIGQAWIPAKTMNPVQAYAGSHKLKLGRVIYKWEVDLNNNGKREMLLETKATPSELAEEIAETRGNMNENVKEFTVYIPNLNGSGYTESKGLDEGDGMGVGPGAGMTVDVTQCYVGYIAQLKQWGLVTIESDSATDKAPAQARIFAYTIERDHLKERLLAKYDPNKGRSAVYNRYLSESKRTKVQLQEVTP